jgi:ankyrin repeat protein
VDLVDVLLDRGADPEARSRDGSESRTPLHDSYEHGQEAITLRLLERGAVQDISVAAARGDFDRVEELLAVDPALANDPSNGLSPLGWAGYGRDPRMVPFLVARGARLEDEIGCPASTGSVPLLREFLAAGADPDGLLPHWQARPLHVVASLRHSCDGVPAARLLLEAGADVNGRAADGVATPLDVAAFGLALRGGRDERRRAGFETLMAFLAERGGVRGHR